ncbi:hypothetical protein [Pseudooceanicola sp. LIPI14-2-Ac024]|uniref:hypothetical protein n=1 Tax=Pseudooceanicola sp. LIPI14-2-Ac024 TaxID=3344875 RepID=UPI0035CF8E37
MRASKTDSPTERRAQKARTREALLAGARDLVARGEPVTVAAAAQQAGISRATAYRYFSDPAVLTAEAGLAIEVKSYAAVIGGAATPRARVVAVSLYMLDLALEHEAGFRQFLARNLDAWLAEGGTRSLRGARRVPMFEAALENERARLGAARFRTLVNALTAATGSEAMIALLDIAGADHDAARHAVAEIAEALCDRYGLATP